MDIGELLGVERHHRHILGDEDGRAQAPGHGGSGDVEPVAEAARARQRRIAAGIGGGPAVIIALGRLAPGDQRLACGEIGADGANGDIAVLLLADQAEALLDHRLEHFRRVGGDQNHGVGLAALLRLGQADIVRDRVDAGLDQASDLGIDPGDADADRAVEPRNRLVEGLRLGEDFQVFVDRLPVFEPALAKHLDLVHAGLGLGGGRAGWRWSGRVLSARRPGAHEQHCSERRAGHRLSHISTCFCRLKPSPNFGLGP